MLLKSEKGVIRNKILLFSLIFICCLISSCGKTSYQKILEGYVFNTKICSCEAAPQNPKLFNEYILKLSKVQPVTAAYLLGLSYYSGINNKENISQAKKYLLIAAEKGNKNAMFVYAAILFENKQTSEKKRNEIIKWLKKSSQLGNQYAQTVLSILLPPQSQKYGYYQELLKKNSTSFGYAQYYRGYIMSQVGGDKARAKGLYFLKLAYENTKTPIVTRYKAAIRLAFHGSAKEEAKWNNNAQKILRKNNCKLPLLKYSHNLFNQL